MIVTTKRLCRAAFDRAISSQKHFVNICYISIITIMSYFLVRRPLIHPFVYINQDTRLQCNNIAQNMN